MGEDKLTARQRVRLEAFAQAVNSSMAVRLNGDGPPSMEELFARAEKIETWLHRADGH